MNRSANTFKISTQFSKTPGSRFRYEGKFSGQELREDHIAPLLKEAIEKNTKIVIDLDGVAGYGTSFLEEAFGGLIRIDNLPLQKLSQLLSFISKEQPFLISTINSYLNEAANGN